MKNSILKQLPQLALWEHFMAFCAIPRPSKYEQAIITYIRQQGEQHHALVEQDPTGNILLRVPASSGYEQAAIIALQCHVDMVAQANCDSQHDFMKDPLQLQIQDGWLKASDTTLGADNGIGCAAMLALMTDKDVQHGPLELLFTVDEEAGMGGAFGLQRGWLKAEKLLNLDTEEEGEIYIGCAGGVDINSTLKLSWQDTEGERLKVSLSGLLGGHSGVDIHLKRANANTLLAQELLNLSRDFDFQLHSFNGGSLRNAIPREAFADIITTDAEKLLRYLDRRNTLLVRLYQHSEPQLCLTAEQQTATQNPPLSHYQTPGKAQSIALLNLLASHPDGIIKYSDDLPGVVESSNNLGIVTLANGQSLHLQSLCRSASDNERDIHAFRIAQYQKQFNLKVDITGAYPGWQPDRDSQLLRQGLDLYQQLFAKKAKIQVIHAGLECGLLCAVYPECEILSFGPTITGAHSPREQVNISSVDRFWKYLQAFISQLAKS